ncbi:MAG: peroxiredoxin, partial [Kiritimatiellae bacterium]|nr:peroxiredoxin [Kiritimatiellia bacterium]
KLADLKGQWVVLYFYPKSFTPGCTKEACSLRDGYPGIQETGAVILGVSTDSLETQEKFKARYNLPFDLLADPHKVICRAYDALSLGGLMAKRTTFIINPDGRIAHIFEKVDADDHETQVRQALATLQKAR